MRSIQLTKGRTGQILVRGAGLCLCGAQNCGFWIFLEEDLTTIDSRRLKLSDYTGRTLVVTLFASWCVPCRANIPDLNVISRNLKKEVQVIGIVARENDRDIEALRSFTVSLDIKFPVVWEEIGFTDSLSNLIQGVHVLPQVFIIDNQGRVRKHFRGFNREYTPALVREALDQLRVKDATRTP